MRRVLSSLAVLLVVLGIAAPAGADGYVDTAVAALRGTRPVFVSAGADPSLTEAEANTIRDRITAGSVPIYVAVLPDAAGGEVGGWDNLPQAIGQRMGGNGVWAVVAGKHFRAGSSNAGLGKGQAGQLATLALQSHQPTETIAPMLLDFIGRVQAAVRSKSSGARIGPVSVAKKKSNAGAVVVTILLVLLGIAGAIGALFLFVALWRSRVRRREEQEAFEQRKRDAQARYAAVADDALMLEATAGGNAKAQAALTEATSAYNRAGTILDSAVTAADVDSAGGDLTRAEGALVDARAYLDGRDPIAERKAEEQARVERERESARLAAERREQQERERAEREERAAKISPETYQPRARRSSTYNHRFEGGYCNGRYYAPGYYRDAFWEGMVIGAIMDSHDDHDHGDHYDGSREDVSYASVSADTGGDWSSTDTGGGGDWGGSSDSGGGFDFGGSDSGGGSDFGGGDSGGGGDW